MTKKHLLIVFSLLFTLFSTSVFGAIPSKEREALIALYNSTNGDNWDDSSGWKNPPLHSDGFAMPGTEATWYGIGVLGDHVTSLNLQQNQLDGSIPTELGKLNHLTRLDLFYNQLSGTIPITLGNLSNVTYFALDYNQLSGSIPPELGNMSSLTGFLLDQNQLSGSIPSELGNLSNLTHLYLDSNQLSGSIPSELGNLANLTGLSLGYNQLSGSIPSELGNLSNLEGLYLSSNPLNGGIPTELGNLSNLEDLQLQSNQLSGSIPTELGNLSNLTRLSLDRNQLSGSIPTELGNLSNLTNLGLSQNRLSGSMPTELGNLNNLEWFSLWDNQLSGSIPTELGNLNNLEYLQLHLNQLSGEIPSTLTNLTKISLLNIGHNCLYATDAALRAWLDSHDPDWETSQNQCGGPKIHLIAVGAHDYGDIDKKQGILWGDRDARSIYNIISGYPDYAKENDKTKVLLWESIMDGSSNLKNRFISALDYLKNRVKEDDTLIIYFSSHGGTFDSGNESTITKCDELVDIGFPLTDDAVFEFINSRNEFSKVNKIFFIDACFSGGFWGNHNSNDSGDLEKLSKVALIAACDEDKMSQANSSGRGLFTLALEGALKNSLDSSKIMQSVINWSGWDKYDGQEVIRKSGYISIFKKESLSISVNKSDDFVESDATLSFYISSPETNTNWQIGEIHNIAWTTEGSIPDIRIELYKDDSLDSIIAESVSNADLYSWEIPSGLPDGDDYSIKISDATNSTISSMSAYFNIRQNPTIAVQSPISMSEWPIGSERIIVWSSTSGISGVKIDLYKGNSQLTTLESSINNTGSYTWSISPGITVGSNYKIRITDTSNGTVYGESEVFSITQASISLNRTQLTFGASVNNSSTESQYFMISNSGSGTLNWSASYNASWLSCTPTSGIGPETVYVSVIPNGLSAGTYDGIITITDPDASNSPQTVNVTLKVYAPGASSEPFGDFSTPIDGSTVSSSIPVTGWVLDDIGVERVKIYRGNAGNLTYIGDTVFAEGARPDVEQAYPVYPMNYKAGWGYMMLTNFLPDGGNGTFKIHAIATDVEGHQITLGTKTIICDNANAVKPFGAIDTPTQGGEASGGSFRNNGWVLTPPPNSIPTDGSSINVFVDGVNLGHPTYNVYRSDIAAFFPGYANSDGAHAYFDFDATAYDNGIHSIYWTAEDSAGNSDGIGSRYFTIQNTGNSSSKTSAARHQRHAREKEPYTFSQIVVIPVNDLEPIKTKKNFRINSGYKPIEPDEEGIFNIKIRELERIVIELSNESSVIGGYTIIGSELRPLPIGSTLDSGKGVFYWQPGPGFFGEYRFVFVEKMQNGEMSRKNVIVTIEPKYARIVKVSQ